MGIDANFKMSIPRDADFPDDIAVERDPGEVREYVYPGIVRQIERELKTAKKEIEVLRVALDRAAPEQQERDGE